MYNEFNIHYSWVGKLAYFNRTRLFFTKRKVCPPRSMDMFIPL